MALLTLLKSLGNVYSISGQGRILQIFGNPLRHGVEHIMEAEAPPHVKDAWPDGWQMFSGVMSLAAFFRMSVLAPE
jgi:hypothetical protein